MINAYKKLIKKLKSLILITTIIYIAVGISSAIHILKQGQATSFPWWSGFMMYLIYFIPVIIIEIAIYLFVRSRYKKEKNRINN